MNLIAEMIGEKAYARLKERYGELVDEIFVEEEGGMRMNRCFKMKYQIFDWKPISTKPTQIEIERTIGVGVAEIEHALYSVLNFDGRNMEQGFHFNNDLPRNGIHMHREIYKELMESERESMRRIEKRLGQSNERKKRGDVNR